MAKKTKKSSTKASGDQVIKIDFGKEEESGGGGIRLPENDYAAKIIKVKSIRSSEKDTPGIAVTCQIAEGKHKGKKITDRLWITPKSLWRIRSLLESLGVSVPKSVVSLPTKKLVGKELGITVTDDEPYQGRIKSRISDFIDLETLNDEDEDEDEDEEGDDEEEDDEDETEDTEEEEDEDDTDEDDEDDDLDELDLDSI